MSFIDGFSFSASVATQGGLNPVDVNKLNTYQQIILYLVPLITSPIAINIGLVYIRIYYFTKEFPGINRHSALLSKRRRTLSRSMSMADSEKKAKISSSSFFRQLEKKIFSRTDASFSTAASSSSHSKTREETTSSSTQPPKRQQLHSLNSNTTPESNENLLPKPVKDRDIKFADTTTTTTKQADGSNSSSSRNHTRKNDISPSDIARSILIMDNRRQETERNLNASDSTLLVINQNGNESDTYLSSDSEIYSHEVSPYHIKSKNKNSGTIIVSSLDEEEEKTDDDENKKNESYFVNIKPIRKAATFDDYLIKTSKKKNRIDNNIDDDDEKIDPISRVKSLDVSKNIKHSDSFDLMISDKRRRRSMSHYRLGNNNNNNTHEDSDFDGGVLRRAMSSKYLSYQPDIQGNSVFLDLDDKQKDELESVEFRALKVLGYLLTCYYVLWHLCGALCLLIWIKVSPNYVKIVEAFGINDVWWSFFTAASAMNNVGLTLTPNSMGSFIENIFILLVLPFFMIIGNTGFPIFLRFIIWVLFKLTNEYGQLNESLGFLLDHPRRCFTLLFPAGPTWKLLGILVFLNGLDTLLFIVLDLHNEVVTNLPVGYRILAGYFQAVSTRTTGFAVMDISVLHPAVIVSYTVMMYINIFPVAMSVRHTNVYEEQTLGALNSKKPSAKPETPHVRTHVMRQVFSDLWFIFIVFFLLCISEGGKITRKENNIPLFNILFEVVSAYGTVGLSLGFPGTMTSLSAQFSHLGKFLMACLLYKGRQRILPYPTDRAIMMPRRIVEEDMVQEDLLKQRENNIRRFRSI